MSKQEVFICDVCGAHRKEANHWFCAMTTRSDALIVHRWPVAINDEGFRHLCGESCLHKYVSGWVAK